MSETQPSVTVVVRRRVKPDKRADYEAWLDRLIRAASGLPGYLGAHVERPGPEQPSEYVSVFRFDSLAHLDAFERSELRRRALAEVVDYVEADAIWSKLTGLELWFTPPPGTVVPQPSRWRMVVILTALVYGLVLSIGKLVALVLADAPAQLRLLVTIAIEVTLMTYVLMPLITRRLARFIYPAGPGSDSDQRA